MSSAMLSAEGRAINKTGLCPHETFLMGETKHLVRYRLIRGKEKKQRSGRGS